MINVVPFIRLPLRLANIISEYSVNSLLVAINTAALEVSTNILLYGFITWNKTWVKPPLL